jgi:CheY-like chemotaxis protein
MHNGSDTLVALLVEDEWLVREEIADALRAGGWCVFEAASGESALAFLRSGQHIDVVITDIQLAGELTGWDVAEEFRAARPDIPVIYASGNSHENPRKVQGSVFFNKPYCTSDLLEACAGLCQAGDSRPERA